ncbi:hypothetical protein KI387_039609, partial [Taxus chinensis]
AALGTVGTSGCEPAEKPPGGPGSKGTSKPKRRGRRERANWPKAKEKLTNCCAKQVETSGPKEREGREKAKRLQRGTRKPISG